MYKNPIPTSSFLSKQLNCASWDSLEYYFQELEKRPIKSKTDLFDWLEDRSSLDRYVSEYYAWLFISQSTNTACEVSQKEYINYIENVYPNVLEYGHLLDKKVADSVHFDELYQERFGIYKRTIKNQINLYQEHNAKLEVEMDLIERQYGEQASVMTIDYNGEKLTLQRAECLLADKDREVRKVVFDKMRDCSANNAENFNLLFDDLVKIRTKIASNSGFENYRDYAMRKLERFDYGVVECESLHYAIKLIVKPLMDKILKRKKKKLGYDILQPYDLKVIPGREASLSAFDSVDELIKKTKRGLDDVDPFFGSCLSQLKEYGRLDLENRYGKAPGGYNMPLLDSGLPFIFMNATGSSKNVCTMFHEVGHAVHSVLCAPLPYYFDNNLPAEIAELASMSMELFTLDGHKYFYNNENDILDSQQQKMERSLSSLLWIGIIDEFQHWIYTHPGHSVEEREVEWKRIFKSFNSDVVNWDDHEDYIANLWQKQSHLFYFPFYFIEYGIAQLGAFALWKNYKENPAETLKNYKEALSLGYTKSLPELYKTAGIRFDFSFGCFKKVADFVWDEWLLLENKKRVYSN